jgi:starch-binding outer membrane protein SusE/F
MLVINNLKKIKISKMKNILSIGFAILLSSVIITSCKKKNDNPVIKNNTGLALTVNTPGFPDTVKMSIGSATNDALHLQWSAADFGFDAATKYTVEMMIKGGNWEDAVKRDAKLKMDTTQIIVKPNDTSNKTYVQVVSKIQTDTFTQEKLNAIVNKLGIAFGSTAVISTRIKASIPGSNIVAYSNAVDKVVSTYNTVIIYNKLWIPGDYQNWTPSDPNCPYIEEKIAGNGVFTGLVEKTKADGTLSGGGFKITPAQNWNYDFGDNGSTLTNLESGSGLIGPKFNGTNGTDFKLADGTYFLTVDTVNRTWSYKLENWGIVGDATPLGWPSGSGLDPTNTQNAQNLRYNPDSKMYEITINLTGGKSILFRKNDDWASKVAYAAGVPKNDPLPLGTPVVGSGGGEDIGIAVSGNYTIKLDPKTFTILAVKN